MNILTNEESGLGDKKPCMKWVIGENRKIMSCKDIFLRKLNNYRVQRSLLSGDYANPDLFVFIKKNIGKRTAIFLSASNF